MKIALIICLFPILPQNKKKPIKIAVEATYGLHPNKYFEIFNLTFGERSLVTCVSGFIQIPKAIRD